MTIINLNDNYNFSGEKRLVIDEGILNERMFNLFNAKNKLKEIRRIPSFYLNLNSQGESEIKLINFGKRSAVNSNTDIIKVIKDSNSLMIQTFNYVGVIFKDGFQFNINSRFGNTFLKRMLNFLDDVFIQESEFITQDNKDDINSFQLIIFYLFLQSLNKALITGFPSEYILENHRGHTLKGKLDINNFIKNDIPFKGMISSKFRERKPIKLILAVIYKALNIIIRKNPSLIKNQERKIFNDLSSYGLNSNITKSDFIKLNNHKALSNPIYALYKTVLKYAELIINDNGFNSLDKLSENKSVAYLFDISELFEIYLKKLMQRYLTEYTINHQYYIPVYQDAFYKRLMIPDFVLENEDKKVIVLDAKYKGMSGNKRDLDREDFYQIHSYMSYFSDNLLAGSLLYPISNDIDYTKTIQPLFGNNKNTSKFFVSGIKLTENMTFDEISNSENDFINSIKNII